MLSNLLLVLPVRTFLAMLCICCNGDYSDTWLSEAHTNYLDTHTCSMWKQTTFQQQSMQKEYWQISESSFTISYQTGLGPLSRVCKWRMQTRTMKKPTFKGHTGVREATTTKKNLAVWCQEQLELTLQNSVSHETGNRTFLARQTTLKIQGR